MKRFPYFQRFNPRCCAVIFLILPGSFLPTASRADGIIIDANFKPAAASGAAVDLATLTTKSVDLPLNAPSGVFVMPPSTAKVAPSQANPSAYESVFDVEPRANTDAAAGNAMLSWNLKAFALNSGKYELTYDFILLSSPKMGAKMSIDLAGPDGKFIKTTPPIHSSQLVIAGIDGDGKFRARNKAVVCEINTLMHAKILVDMNRHVWSAYLNDEEVVRNVEFPVPLLEAEPHPIILQICFGSTGGLGDKAPFKFALSNVRLIRKSDLPGLQ